MYFVQRTDYGYLSMSMCLICEPTESIFLGGEGVLSISERFRANLMLFRIDRIYLLVYMKFNQTLYPLLKVAGKIYLHTYLIKICNF